MDNRKADIGTFPTETPNRVIKAWISHDAWSRSYRLTVVPAEVKVYDDGVVMHTVKAYSGGTVHLETSPRYSRRKLDALVSDQNTLDWVTRLVVSLDGII
jgi:hypothetical protein